MGEKLKMDGFISLQNKICTEDQTPILGTALVPTVFSWETKMFSIMHTNITVQSLLISSVLS